MAVVTLQSIITTAQISFGIVDRVSQVIETMNELSISSVVVVDDENVPVGIVTEHDFLRLVSGTVTLEMRLQEVMTPNPFCLFGNVSLHDAYMSMEGKQFRHIVVIDENKRFMGVVTEGDFLRHIGLEELDKFKIVSDIMNRIPLIVSTDQSVSQVAQLMKQSKTDFALLVKDEKPIGILTERDIAFGCISQMEFGTQKVENLARRDFMTVSQECMLNEAASKMAKHSVHQLLVVDENKNFIGSLSRHDLLHAVHGSYFEFLLTLLDEKNSIIEELEGKKRQLKEEKNHIQMSRHKYQKLFEAIPDSVVLLDAQTTLPIEFNSTAHLTLGYTAEEFKNVSISDYEVVESPEDTKKHIAEIIKNGQKRFETVHKTKYGEKIDVLVDVVPVDIDEKKCMIAIFQDITKRKEKEKESDQIQALAHIGTWTWDIAKDEFTGSIEAYSILGIPYMEKITFQNILECFEPKERERVKYQLTQAYQQTPLLGSIYEVNTREGERKWIKTSTEFIYNHMNEPIKAIGIFQDFTERIQYEKQLEVLANYDSLTGLTNRAYLVTHIEQTIKSAKRNNEQFAMLMFDLDRFKDINDSYGHSCGDELLVQVAQRFSSRLREGDLISRLGGDEFAVVMQNLSHPEDAGRLADEMIKTLTHDYKLSTGISVHIGASAGIVIYPDNAEAASTLLQYGDAALYKSKEEGRGIYRYYTDELTAKARKRLDCEAHLRRAIIQNEMEVYYQPQVHIASGRMVGAEALIRWNNPDRGLVSPLEFIPMAEEIGLINELGEWILRETCRQGKIWMDQGYRLTLAVNLSPHQIRTTDIPVLVERVIKSTGFDPQKLELEITESALMQREEENVQMLHTLRAKGIRVAIDDFGTGYSSLSYLKRFPIDVLKIDKSFIDDVPYEQDDVAIVTAIIAMGQALNFQVLAEGVEHIEQLKFLQDKDCTMFQGYLKSKPLPAQNFEQLLLKEQD